MKDFFSYAFGVFTGMWIASNSIPNWLFWSVFILIALVQVSVKFKIKYK